VGSSDGVLYVEKLQTIIAELIEYLFVGINVSKLTIFKRRSYKNYATKK
jgi:hypothetical protein